MNQLASVTKNGVTTNYTYQNGNIQSVTQNGTAIKTYGYTDSTWGDLLTSFNGQTITYDTIGNPLQYRDGMSFTWAKGRQLQSVTKDGLNASYTYDENGLRLSKTVNGVTTKIYRTNGQAVGMNSSDGKDMTFLLDGDGNVYGVHYDHYASNQPKSETYYFAYNAQGDVIGIYEFSGRLMVTYDYDAWGNCTVNVLSADNNGHATDSPDHIAYANPFRYRGYFYDAETGFYYLNSRYYDPETGRFVNADGLIGANQDIHAYNLFAYCSNNPVNLCDPTGKSVLGAIAAALGSILGAAAPWIIAFVGVAVIGLGIMSTPAINDAIATGIGAVSSSIAQAKSAIKEKSTARRKAKDSDPRIHHMVAQAAWRAAPARIILEDVGIDPKIAPENLITISHGLHKSMHTKRYYEYVNNKLLPCAGDRVAVEAALLEIRADIEFAEATGIKRWDIE